MQGNQTIHEKNLASKMILIVFIWQVIYSLRLIQQALFNLDFFSVTNDTLA